MMRNTEQNSHLFIHEQSLARGVGHAVFSDPLEIAVFQDTQNLGLCGKRQVRDFIEEQGSFVCRFE